MSGPDRIYLQDAGDYESAADFEVTWCVVPQDDADTEYIRRDPAVLAALPEVQALIAGACDRFRGNLRETFDAMCAMRDAINEHIPMPSLESDLLHGPENSVFCATVAESIIDAIAARDAMIAAAETRALDSVTTLHRVISDVRAATVGTTPMLSDLAQALVAWRDEAVKAERQTIADACTDRADYLDDAAKWGGSKQYLASLKGGVVELRNMHAAIRKRGEGQP